MIKKDVENIFWNGNDFLLASHLNPDGDAVGSLLGLGLTLRELGKNVTVTSPHPVPCTFSFLPGYELIQAPGNLNNLNFDIGVVLDCTEVERTGKETEELLKNCNTLLNIDHHVSNTKFGNLNLVDTDAAATGELIFEILEDMGVPITPEIATNLYVTIVTDTGSFQHQNTTARCHRNAASLLKLGAAHNRAYQLLYEERSLKSMRLLEKCLRTLSVSDDGLVAWMAVPQKYLIETGCGIEECDELVNYPKSISGVEVGILFKQVSNNEVKVSFRSKNYVDVNNLAASFGGGGHERAAGCTVRGTLKDVERKVLAATANFLPGAKGAAST